ncbi:hypothetical protein [Paenibacillus sinopodophylli]|uniref:hypothetical protein n=1 Tax=Paenibacillus sinopodophylli TaxID=1837342 RepID=UPI00110CD65F|nr:hypothetical protein [Paenibacillus sinopodophylli]
MTQDLSYAYLAASVEAPKEDDSKWFIPDWVNDLGGQLRDITQTFGDLMSGKLIKDAVDGVVIGWTDEFLAPLYGTFAKSYLFTPHIAEIKAVFIGWSIVSLISLMALLVGIGMLSIQIIKGKKEMGQLLKVFFFSFIAAGLSLTVMNFINVGLNWLTQSSLAGIIGTSDITYQNLTGEEILKSLVIGIDSVSNPAYAGMSLGQLMAETEGGIFVLIFDVMGIIVPSFFLSMIKSMIVIVMAIFAGLWIAYTAYSGKLETLVGFLNIYTRTLFAGYIMGVYWAVFVKAQTDYGADMGFMAELGIHPAIAAPITACGLFVLLFFIWLRPAWRAAKMPVHLNGGQAIEALGTLGSRSSMALNAMGKRFGNEALQRKGLSWSQSTNRVAEVGRRMQERNVQKALMKSLISGGGTEALQGVKYEAPAVWETRTGHVVMRESGQVVTHQGLQMLDLPAHELEHQLKPEGFEAGAVMMIDQENRADMVKMVDRLTESYGESVTYNARTGELLVAKNVKPVLQELQESNIKSKVSHGYTKNGVFVDAEKQDIRRFTRSQESQETLNALQEQLPVYTKTNLSGNDAIAAYNQLSTKEKQYPWVKQLKLVDGQLWIPEMDMPEIVPLLQNMRNESVSYVRFDLPRGSNYLADLDRHMKSQRDEELLAGMEANVKDNYIMVRETQAKRLEEVHKHYRETKVPFWRTMSGKIMVIMDGMPVDHGHQPLNGMDMGSFEQLQTDMLSKHEGRNKKKGGKTDDRGAKSAGEGK